MKKGQNKILTTNTAKNEQWTKEDINNKHNKE